MRFWIRLQKQGSCWRRRCPQGCLGNFGRMQRPKSQSWWWPLHFQELTQGSQRLLYLDNWLEKERRRILRITIGKIQLSPQGPRRSLSHPLRTLQRWSFIRPNCQALQPPPQAHRLNQQSQTSRPPHGCFSPTRLIERDPNWRTTRQQSQGITQQP